MITFLCALTPRQWARAHHRAPDGVSATPPEGYARAGLYEGRDQLWLVQYAGNRAYRYWSYAGLWMPPAGDATREDLLEMALNERAEAERLQAAARALIARAERHALNAERLFNDALVGADDDTSQGA